MFDLIKEILISEKRLLKLITKDFGTKGFGLHKKQFNRC